MDSLILKLYLSFLKIGSFAFGGGLAVLPLIEKELISSKHWIDSSTFIDMIGISQVTPGPFAINGATYVGYSLKGVSGAIVATLGVITTSFILSLLGSKFLKRFSDVKAVKAVFLGMRPVLLGLIISAFISVSKTSYIGSDILKSILIGVITLALSLNKKIHPILVIVIAAILGLVVFSL